MRAADAVITRPANVPRSRRVLYGCITFLAWVAFLWLLAPTLWAIGLRAVTPRPPAGWNVGPVDPEVATIVFAVSAVAAGALLVWAEVQRRRFTGVERRERAPDADSLDMADALGCDATTAAFLQRAKVVTLRMQGDGSPAAACVKLVPRPRHERDGERDDERVPRIPTPRAAPEQERVPTRLTVPEQGPPSPRVATQQRPMPAPRTAPGPHTAPGPRTVPAPRTAPADVRVS